ncbi:MULTISPECIES: STAS domain-containing protein [Aliivibrio]|uniref:STAS domain-containing protein n=1 Tax=Aliivibrio finisterrensis TaxID=511998 RepID=A0A4Q5KYZ4_9GAMM|nr:MULTISPECIES: lipid asymmetry maintenance protein MlaB [Aliivibrio]KAB2824140.1 STAS domain-containing protein [Aliivibrio finisterrensis]MDD9177525.1 lipid asymmetry maintenance protein MlaB [Aliivibrio sp. A6]RYU54049.1 STAS domain-containing protein [Aliivibrio finisterrensis]RYU56178.1 STAS domain-containing protein [Aliivibrio finisterrensis]RYU61010.1 STAS domain-containing protein [Aliivibrio finisterrensis]
MLMMDLCETKIDEIHLNGALDRETVPNIWKELTEWKPKSTQVKVDLGHVNRIDSAGVVLLLHLIEHAKNQNCHIMLAFVPDQLITLIQLSNVESLFADHLITQKVE